MSLIEDVKEAVKKEWCGYLDEYESLDDVDVVLEKIIDTTRWGVIKEMVVKRGEEYVMLVWEEAAAEGDYCEMPEVTAVTPVTKTVVAYAKL